ncbi:MAG TPA: DUF4388 domain-containing protein, partial [Labilithrix sp.]|nr:DUF4388 domain-containing protein [Labilithrix sp.]
MTAPSAVGTLADTPLAHGLIYARNRRLSGRLELTAPDDRRASISLWRGRITAVETTPAGMCPGGFLGSVVYELGYIDSPMLDATLMEIAKTKRLHGEVLIERRAITAAQRDEALVEQVHRKVHHLFTLPPSTTYAFYDARVTADEPSVAVDPLGPVWRGVRDYPPTKFVEETMRRIGDNVLRATAGGSARLPPAETALTEALAMRPMTLAEMKVSSELPPSRVELLVYLLVIAKCVESVAGTRTHPSTGALPTGMPSGPMPAVRSGIPQHSGSIPSMRAPSSGRLPAAQPAPSAQPSPLSNAPFAMPPGPQRISSARFPATRPPFSVTPPPQPLSSSLSPATRPPFSVTPPAQPLSSSLSPATRPPFSVTPPPQPLSSSKFPAQRPLSMTPPAQPLSSSKFPVASPHPPAGSLAGSRSPV